MTPVLLCNLPAECIIFKASSISAFIFTTINDNLSNQIPRILKKRGQIYLFSIPLSYLEHLLTDYIPADSLADETIDQIIE